LLSLAAVALSGCGGGDPYAVKTVPAAGSVTYKGKPLSNGTIMFQPVKEEGRPASGVIQDGKFTLTTYNEGDGAVAGKHKVAVVVANEVKTKDGDTTLKYIVPQKYASPETSGVEVDVPDNGSQDLKVEIK
jgi:hypothetical protein